jgi:hypothetical protein
MPSLQGYLWRPRTPAILRKREREVPRKLQRKICPMRSGEQSSQSESSEHESGSDLADTKIRDACSAQETPHWLVHRATKTTARRFAGSTSGVGRVRWQLSKMRRIRPSARRNYFDISGSTRTRMNHTVTLPGCEFDEALWTAYRRRDKVAVTRQLLNRFVAEVVSARQTASHGISRRARVLFQHQGLN